MARGHAETLSSKYGGVMEKYFDVCDAFIPKWALRSIMHAKSIVPTDWFRSFSKRLLIIHILALSFQVLIVPLYTLNWTGIPQPPPVT